MEERDNQKKKPRLPLGARLLAASYGSGQSQHLAVLLSFIPTSAGGPKLVVWNWNSQSDGVGNGDYLERDESEPRLMWIQRGWDVFSDRSKILVLSSTVDEEE